LKAWDIFSYQPSGWPEPHPAVVVSHPDRVAQKPEVNILMCSSQRATRDPKPHEVILDEADGLDWPTLCKCDLLHAVGKKDLKQRRGRVTAARRQRIIATINRANDWV
jgi:mRNA-degrading endonuclease toxin of MazEF toxin-antitoxin module